MPLDLQVIKRELDAPSKKNEIQEAIMIEARIRFHYEMILRDGLQNYCLTDWLNYCKSLIDEDKYEIFTSLIRLPLNTNELLAQIYSVLEKVFDGRDKYTNHEFKSDRDETDWMSYRPEYFNPTKWKEKAWDIYKSYINSIQIVDAKEELNGRYPEVYTYFLHISNAISWELEKDSTTQFEWFIFKGEKFEEGHKVFAMDEERVRVFYVKDNKIIRELADNPHPVKKCPAKFFWHKSLSQEYKHIKVNDISYQLGNLDTFAFKFYSKLHLDLTSAFPIYYGFETDCDYTNERDDYCEGGFVKSVNHTYYTDSKNMIMRCPLCSKKRAHNPGSYFAVPIPGEDTPVLNDPIKMLSADVDSLKYNSEDLLAWRTSIFDSITGKTSKVIDNQQVNMPQLFGGVEDRKQVYLNLKQGFELAQKWAEETMCKWRYEEGFIDVQINYGTEFYFFTTEEIISNYKAAKDSGAGPIIIDFWYRLMIETQYKNNPEQLEKAKIIMDLEPYRHLKSTDILTINGNNPNDPNFILKSNFSYFISKFEREVADLTLFGKNLQYSQKINLINQNLLKYVEEFQANRQTGQTGSEPGGNTNGGNSNSGNQ